MPVMAAADIANFAPFRDRFVKVAFNAFAITRPINVFQGARSIVRRNMRLLTTPSNQPRFQDDRFPTMARASAAEKCYGAGGKDQMGAFHRARVREDCMGRAARKMAISSLHLIDGVPRCPTERLRQELIAAGSPGAAAGQAVDRGVAFRQHERDPEQEYFADGMVEEVITALSCIRWLFESDEGTSQRV